VERITSVQLQTRLLEALPGASCSVRDDSHLHAGHAGAQGGAAHFHVQISAPQLQGLSKVRQHRLVYDAVHDWMPERIHALQIDIQSL
jgi:BolA family transcriptional regulator, general stress-responsive regulator